ncbi:enterobactin synthase subunit F [compost metagenome]
MLTHFRAARDHQDRDLQAAMWAPYALGVDRIDLPFLHAEMVSPEAVAMIAPEIARRLS